MAGQAHIIVNTLLTDKSSTGKKVYALKIFGSMQCLLAFLMGLCLYVGIGSAAEITDISYICNGRLEGDLVAHPMDCQAYFRCAMVPTLLYCKQGLLFDAVRMVCDEAINVQCSISTTLSTLTTPSDIDSSTNTTPDFSWLVGKPHPVFVAVDVVSGQPTDPMSKYDPQHIECRHFGAYFLPHPRTCQEYFICAYGHLHRHQCGRGTRWNYKSSECQLANVAECYAQSGSEMVEDPIKFTEISPTTNTFYSTHTTPTFGTTDSGNQVTVCYVVNGGSTVFSTSEITTGTSPIPTESTVYTRTGTTPKSTTEVNTPRVEPSSLTCPSNRQSYMSHPDDCSKYYICIKGMPVLTSCPKGLFWDQKSGYCDQAKYVKCFQDA